MQHLSVDEILEMLGYRNSPRTITAWRRSFPDLRASVLESSERELERMGAFPPSEECGSTRDGIAIRRFGGDWIVSDRERGSSRDSRFKDIRTAAEAFIGLCERRWQALE